MKKSFVFSIITILALLIVACQPEVITETVIEEKIVEVEVEVEAEGVVTIGYGAPELSGEIDICLVWSAPITLLTKAIASERLMIETMSSTQKIPVP